MALFHHNNEINIDAARFFNMAKGLHAVTTFEQSDHKHNLETKGSFMKVVDKHHVLVNGPGKTVDVLNKHTLSKIINLDTEGQAPFSAILENGMLFVGCNKGHLYNWNAEHGFGQRNFLKLQQAVSNILVLQSQKKIG